jgi:hypothetical protein
VYNLAGQQVATAQRQPQQKQMKMQLDNLPQGLYVVRVSGRSVATRKVLLR